MLLSQFDRRIQAVIPLCNYAELKYAVISVSAIANAAAAAFRPLFHSSNLMNENTQFFVSGYK